MILIYVEDPGAANFVAELPGYLRSLGARAELIAEGPAQAYLSGRGVPYHPPEKSPEADLARYAPSVLVVGTSENVDTRALDLVRAARDRGIVSVGVVDAESNAAFRFRGRSQDPLARAPDWLAVTDAWIRDAFVALGFPSERVVVCGHPHFDYVRSVGERLREESREAMRERLFPGLGPGQPVVVFVSEVHTGLNADQYQKSPEFTLHGRGDATGRTHVVLEELLDGLRSLSPRPYVTLRLHPKNRAEEFAVYAPELDRVSQEEPALEVVFAADLVVGMASSLLQEAALLGRPTLSIAPRELERGWLPCIRAGVTPFASRREEVRRLLELFWKQPESFSSNADRVFPSRSLQQAGAFLANLSLEAVNE